MCTVTNCRDKRHIWFAFCTKTRFFCSSCAPLKWPVSQEASWLPHWPMAAFVQSQASACWALKLCVTPWVSCIPVACMTSLESLPSMWVIRNSGIFFLNVYLPPVPPALSCVQVGLPAKSGISGAILLVVPNIMGIMCWSPPLDRLGNSVRGIHFSQVIRPPQLILISARTLCLHNSTYDSPGAGVALQLPQLRQPEALHQETRPQKKIRWWSGKFRTSFECRKWETMQKQ